MSRLGKTYASVLFAQKYCHPSASVGTTVLTHHLSDYSGGSVACAKVCIFNIEKYGKACSYQVN